MKKLIENLNKSMNFSFIINEMSELAYEIIKDIRKKEYRFNSNKLLKEDLKFECENFLYDKTAYPEIKVDDSILKHEEILNKYFNTKLIKENNNSIKYYEYKEDSNIILLNLNNNIVLRYNNNFINEKTNLIDKEMSDNRSEKITELLINENKYGEINNLDKILENVNINANYIENTALLENVINYIHNNYEDLSKLNEDCDLTYNEIVKNGKILPILSCIDLYTENVVSMYVIECNEIYKDNYKYNLKKIFES